MKQEMFEFLFSITTGHEYDVVPAMRAPHGQIVYGRKYVPRHMRPMFPGHETLSHRPELHQRYSPIFAAGVRTAAVPLLTAYPFVTATAHYPTVAGPQYQSAISGQLSIGGDIYTLASPTVGSRKGYKFYELGYWRGY